MEPFNARVVSSDGHILAAELERVGALGPGQQIMSRKATFLLVHLDALPCVAANVLKQEMLARGGDCAVHRDCVTLERDTTSVLLQGTRPQYEELISKLPGQDFGLPDVAHALRRLLANLDAEPRPLQLGRFSLPVGERTIVMGIINVTPDSFSGDALGSDVEAAVAQARRMQAEGADILDIGGESTRPGAETIPVEEELRRVLPVVERLVASDGVPLPLSIDTSKAEVADACLRAGAHMINDITGLRGDPELASAVAEHDAALVIMHIKGTPRTMQQKPHYNDLLGEVMLYLREGVDKAIAAGVKDERIWADPGIGFGKNMRHNLDLLNRLGELRSLGKPILVGTSRKSFIGRLMARAQDGEMPHARERDIGTGATVAICIAHGASAVRVHNVAHAVQVARIADAIVRAPGNP